MNSIAMIKLNLFRIIKKGRFIVKENSKLYS